MFFYSPASLLTEEEGMKSGTFPLTAVLLVWGAAAEIGGPVVLVDSLTSTPANVLVAEASAAIVVLGFLIFMIGLTMMIIQAIKKRH